MIHYDIGQNVKPTLTDGTPIFFISLVGTDASDYNGKGFPRQALSFFDVFSEMEFEKVGGVTFLSVQDLLKFYQNETGRDGKDKNVYQLVLFFMTKNQNGLYFVDEVPLLKNEKATGMGNLF